MSQRNKHARVINYSGAEELPLLRHIIETEAAPGYFKEGRLRSDKGWLLKITLAGEGELHHADKSWRLPAGRAFLVAVNDAQMSYRIAPGASSWHFIYCAMSDPGCRSIAELLVQQRGRVFDCGLQDPLLRKLLREVRKDLKLSELASAALALEIFEALLHWSSLEDPASRQTLTMRAKEFIKARIHEPLTVSSVAAHLKISPEHLSRIFRQDEGITCQQWIQSRRLELARRILLETDLPIKLLADQIGMEAKRFSSWFRNLDGRRPLEIRRGLDKS
ncbi:MAG: Multiple antibiotic resistance protein MarA [Verrucomicrobiota bacterium]|jgi:AraC-like DNA-binding protein